MQWLKVQKYLLLYRLKNERSVGVEVEVEVKVKDKVKVKVNNRSKRKLLRFSKLSHIMRCIQRVKQNDRNRSK
jgi:hypothetical protein